jgi:hypothetical protein
MSWKRILKKDKAAEIMEVINENQYSIEMREHLKRFGIPLPDNYPNLSSLKIVTDNLDKPDFVDYIHRILVTGNELDLTPNNPPPFDFLKPKYPPMEEMIRKLWDNWFYNEMDSFEEYNFEQGSLYEIDYDPEYSKSFSKIRTELEKLDPIDDVDKIGMLLQKLERHPSLPMETITYPTIGLDHDEDDIRAEYDKIK